jgi:hypothetical protein
LWREAHNGSYLLPAVCYLRLRALDVLPLDLRLLEFRPLDFLPPLDFFAPRLRGTLAPFSLASDSPIAIACLRLVTFFPLRPLRNVPFFLRRIADSTRLPAAFPYFFLPPDFFRAAMTNSSSGK